VPSIDLPRAAMIVLLIGVVVGGVALRDAIPAADEPAVVPPVITESAASSSATAVLPSADVPGADHDSLPRYPDSVRVAHGGSRDERLQRVGIHYLAAASVDEVRAFYQEVAAERGWQRADVDYADGGWSYVLVKDLAEALVMIEPADGLVAIGLEVSRLIPADPSTPPAVQPAAPPADNGGDDNDDDDDDDDEDDADGDD
jgi:hypothetical protein